MPHSSRHRPPVRISTQVQTNAILTSGAALCSNLCSARLRSLRSRVASLAGALFSAECPARWRSFRRSARWRSRSLRRWVLRSLALASPLLHWWLAPALGGRRWVSSLRKGPREFWVATHSVPQESHLNPSENVCGQEARSGGCKLVAKKPTGKSLWSGNGQPRVLFGQKSREQKKTEFVCGQGARGQPPEFQRRSKEPVQAHPK